MAAVGGAITEITFNHPKLGQGFFFPKSDVDSTIDLGGYRTDDDAKGVDGSGRRIKKMSLNCWMVETEIAHDMVTEEELETLSALAADPEDANWTFTHISGAVYAGKGNPVGDVKSKAKDATIAIKISGGGELKKI